MTERRCCGSCGHHTPPEERTGDWTCGNEESENYGLPTEYSDKCEDYERRE